MLMAAAVVILSDTTPSMFIQDIYIEIFYAGTVITPLLTHTKNKDKKKCYNNIQVLKKRNS